MSKEHQLRHPLHPLDLNLNHLNEVRRAFDDAKAIAQVNNSEDAGISLDVNCKDAPNLNRLLDFIAATCQKDECRA